MRAIEGSRLQCDLHNTQLSPSQMYMHSIPCGKPGVGGAGSWVSMEDMVSTASGSLAGLGL